VRDSRYTALAPATAAVDRAAVVGKSRPLSAGLAGDAVVGGAATALNKRRDDRIKVLRIDFARRRVKIGVDTVPHATSRDHKTESRF
jgi:hypothetical protein